MQFFVHNIEVNGHSVEMRCYIPEAAPHAKFQTNRPAVIVLPGGAYSGLYGGEAEPIALKYLAQGVCSFVLYYSVKPARFPQALLEGLQSIRYVRENAEAFGIDPTRIAVCGFSAGGHLAGTLGTMWGHSCLDGMLEGDRRLYRPDKMILCYPVTSYESHRGSFKNLLGEENLTPENVAFLSVQNQVNEETAEAFIWHNYDDPAVSVGEALLLGRTLYQHKVPLEMRIFSKGGHGTCLGNYITKGREFGDNQECCDWVEGTLPFLFR